MIWLTWRQQRTETLIAVALLAALAAVLIPTGLHVASVYDSEGLGGCVANDTHGCADALHHAVYHPASRFWLFQGIEAAIFLGLALALGAFAVWWVRDRIS